MRRGPTSRIKGSALIVPLNRCDFMAEIGQDGKEQILPWAAQGALLQGIAGFMRTERIPPAGSATRPLPNCCEKWTVIVETDEDIRKQVLLGARERGVQDHPMGMHSHLPFPLTSAR